MADFANILSTIAASAGFGQFAPVVLGGFEFSQYEVPEQIKFGGKQKLVSHVRPGGQRQYDAMGTDPSNIEWSGIFLSPDAPERAQQLDAMKDEGEAVTLTWGGFSYNVVIDSLDLEYKRQNWVTYKITCCVVQPNQNPTNPTLLSSAVDDLNAVLGINLSPDLSDVSSSLQRIVPLVSTTTVLTGGSPSALRILTAVNSAQSITTGLSLAANNDIVNLDLELLTAGGNANIVSVLQSLALVVNDVPLLLAVSNYLGRMGNNLTNPTAG